MYLTTKKCKKQRIYVFIDKNNKFQRFFIYVCDKTDIILRDEKINKISDYIHVIALWMYK